MGGADRRTRAAHTLGGVASLLVLAINNSGATGTPPLSLAPAVAGWVVAFVSRVEVTSPVGAAVFSIGLVAAGSLMVTSLLGCGVGAQAGVSGSSRPNIHAGDRRARLL